MMGPSISDAFHKHYMVSTPRPLSIVFEVRKYTNFKFNVNFYRCTYVCSKYFFYSKEILWKPHSNYQRECWWLLQYPLFHSLTLKHLHHFKSYFKLVYLRTKIPICMYIYMCSKYYYYSWDVLQWLFSIHQRACWWILQCPSFGTQTSITFQVFF